MILMFNDKIIVDSLVYKEKGTPKSLTDEEFVLLYQSKEFKDELVTYLFGLKDTISDTNFFRVIGILYKNFIANTYTKIIEIGSNESKKYKYRKNPFSHYFRLRIDGNFEISLIKELKEQGMDSTYSLIKYPQLSALNVRSKDFTDIINVSKEDMEMRNRFITNKENIDSICRLIKYYTKNIRLSKAKINTSCLKEFMMVMPDLQDFDNPVYEEFKRRIETGKLSREEFYRDSVYSIGGSLISVENHNLFLTRSVINKNLNYDFKDLDYATLYNILFYKIFGYHKEEVELSSGKRYPLIFVALMRLGQSATVVYDMLNSLDNISI